jgi:hypothetical protein
MPELELTRTRDDKKLYVLEGVGSLRLRGWWGRTASAETAAGDRSWELEQRGVFKSSIEAYDSAGTSVGAYEPRTFRRGGALTWQGHAYGLRPASAWKERYALTSGEGDSARELAIVEGKGWGKRPVRVDVPDLTTLPSGLLLFTVFIVRALAEDASTAATGAATSGAVIASS